MRIESFGLSLSPSASFFTIKTPAFSLEIFQCRFFKISFAHFSLNVKCRHSFNSSAYKYVHLLCTLFHCLFDLVIAFDYFASSSNKTNWYGFVWCTCKCSSKSSPIPCSHRWQFRWYVDWRRWLWNLSTTSSTQISKTKSQGKSRWSMGCTNKVCLSGTWKFLLFWL